MTKVLITESHLDDIGDAIRAKNGEATLYKPSEMAPAILAIPSGGGSTSDATATAADILATKTAYIADGKTTGTMPNNGAVAGVIDADNPSYTVPAGYHNGSGTVSADVATTQEVLDYMSSYGTVSVPMMTRAQWDALTTAQKKAYGLVAIQDANAGFDRGELVNGADYIGDILQSGTAAASASFSASVTGTYKLIVIAMNGEASTKTLTISAVLNSTSLTGETLSYNTFSYDQVNPRNYRVNAYDIEVESGDTISIELSDRGTYCSFVYLITNADITEIVQVKTMYDAACSGSYTSNAIVLQGTFNGGNGGTVNLQGYAANTTIQTDNPGSSYKSGYIFWCA